MRIKQVSPRNADMSSLKGYVTADYARLVEVFGKPNSKGDGYKIDVQWIVQIGGIVCTIYNYKDGPNYLGKHAQAITGTREWHIGGFSTMAVQHVRKALGLAA